MARGSMICLVLFALHAVFAQDQDTPSVACSQAISNYQQCLSTITRGLNDGCSGICRDAFNSVSNNCQDAAPANSIYKLFNLVCIGTNNRECTHAITDVNTNELCHLALQGNANAGCEGNCRTLLNRVTDACSNEPLLNVLTADQIAEACGGGPTSAKAVSLLILAIAAGVVSSLTI